MIAIEPDDIWFNRPVLDVNETLLKSYAANRTQGKRAVGGKLFLTTRRLVFVPNRVESKLGGQVWEASREVILSVGRDPARFKITEIFSGALRSRLAVSASSGTTEFFVVSDLDTVIADLSGYIQDGKIKPIV